jgi:glycosyltransferase involved in cell wall biosynthesis
MTTPLDLSILFATRNRADLLRATLEGIAAQKLPAGLRWEVLVADNGSTDATPRVLEELAARLPLVVVREDRPGKNRALNQALARARGRFLLFTDDDIVPDPRWAAEMLAAADRWPAASVFAGRITPLFPDQAPEWLRRHPFVEAAYARFELPQAEGPTRKLPFGPSFGVRAAAMAGTTFHEDIGPNGQDYVAGSETELLQRLQQRGEQIVYVPTSTVGHVVRPEQLDVEWLFGRSYRLGRCLVALGFVKDQTGPRIAGVPCSVWLRFAKEWAFHRLHARSPDDRRRFLGGLDYHFLRGCIRQHRLASRPAAPR